MIKGIRSYSFSFCVYVLWFCIFDYKEDFVIALLVIITPSHTIYYKACIVAAFSLFSPHSLHHFPILTQMVIMQCRILLSNENDTSTFYFNLYSLANLMVNLYSPADWKVKLCKYHYTIWFPAI